MKRLLNAHSVKLEKNPFMDIEVKPVYENGEFAIYKLYDKHYLHTFGNIVFAERCAPNIEMIENIINDNVPAERGDKYHQYAWPKETIAFGIEYAKKINFPIN